MPLRVVKEIHVVPGKNKVSASLVRICAKIHVTVRNSTLDKMIWIKDISLNDISPDKTYLFEQDSFFPWAVYEELEKMTTAIGLAPNTEMTFPAVFLFETNKAPGIKIRGGVFNIDQKDPPHVITKDISSYSFEETSESLSTGNQYLVMNKSMRYLLKGHQSGSVGIDFLASGDGPKNHLLASSDIEDYIWSYESKLVWGYYFDLKNIGQNKYLRNSSGKLYLSTSIDDFDVIGDKTNGYTISSGNNYIWNNAGTLDFNNRGKSPHYQWYFYKVNSVTTQEEVFDGAEALINYSDNDLSHIDPDLGVAVPLQRIKRNESIDIRVNIFFNKNTGKLDFETEIWKTVDNETTFD
ncbi:unknown [Bacteroides sp. CAG:1060]|nr:unknown [Bacteroides sp. CAG:1060]